jgi:hypothetical protein
MGAHMSDQRSRTLAASIASLTCAATLELTIYRTPLKAKFRKTLAVGAIASLALLGHAAPAADPQPLACIGAKVYRSPTAPPIENAVLILEGG